MKIGIFSDVHGHLPELKKTLALFDVLGVDEIICCGDLVDKGSDSDAVIAHMQDRAIQCILGNHDEKALRGWLSSNVQLQDTSLQYLSKLPREMTFEWESLTVYFCHANPWFDYSVYVFPDRPPVLFQLVADATDAQIIIFGHTHHPMIVTVDNKILLNPGAIYGNRNRPERTCGVLTLPQVSFHLYDIDRGVQIPL